MEEWNPLGNGCLLDAIIHQFNYNICSGLNVLHILTHLNTWPQLLTLYEEVSELWPRWGK